MLLLGTDLVSNAGDMSTLADFAIDAIDIARFTLGGNCIDMVSQNSFLGLNLTPTVVVS